MSDASERRRFPRIESQHAVLVTQLGEERCEELSKTQGLGEGGLSFMSREPFEPGAMLELAVTLYGKVVRATGRVAYARPNDSGELEIGVEFLQVPESDRKKLEQILS
ncbi:MAG: PilZ domain-containing protein [bacterium]|nr:PilZ domain-containing protein [bacterium]